MQHDLFAQVDAYIEALFVPQDAVFERALQRAEAAALPQIQVSAAQGKLLHMLALLCGARAILEVGTLGGYSTIWLARALPPDGSLISLELEPHHAQVAAANIADAGFVDYVDIRVGAALATLQSMRAANAGPFDLIFIDADKSSYVDYLYAALDLSRPGTLIIADNVVRKGEVVNDTSQDEAVRAVQHFNQELAELQRNGRVTCTVLQTIGAKGHDGMALAVVRAGGRLRQGVAFRANARQ
ncbi:O-methyltransferase [Candidatus Gracilibacteria bacterium]|nr:O-methyltransferase [Candidatus Gracilibacteria bacterium]